MQKPFEDASFALQVATPLVVVVMIASIDVGLDTNSRGKALLGVCLRLSSPH